MATAAQVLFDLYIPHQSFLAGEYEMQQSTSPLWLRFALVKKLPAVLSRDLLDGACPAVLSLQQIVE